MCYALHLSYGVYPAVYPLLCAPMCHIVKSVSDIHIHCLSSVDKTFIYVGYDSVEIRAIHGMYLPLQRSSVGVRRANPERPAGRARREHVLSECVCQIVSRYHHVHVGRVRVDIAHHVVCVRDSVHGWPFVALVCKTRIP